MKTPKNTENRSIANGNSFDRHKLACQTLNPHETAFPRWRFPQ